MCVCVCVCVCRVCRVCVCASCKTWRSRLRAMALGSTESLGDDLINRDFIKLYQKKMTGGNSLINYINLIYSCSFTLCTLSRFVNFGCWDSNRRCFLHWQFPWPRDLLRRTEQAETLIFLRDMPRSVNSVSSYCMCCNDIKCISSAPTRSD